ADLAHPDRRDDVLRTFAGEATQQAVDLEGRPRPDPLERRVAALSEEFRRAELLPGSRSVERQLLELPPFLVAQRPYIVVETGDLDAPSPVLHLGEHLGQNQGRVGDRAA